MNLYLKDPKSYQKLLEIINAFGKVAVYKIEIQKSVYIPTMNILRKKSGKHPIYNCLKTNTVPWNKFNKGNQRPFQ
jgi:hypothetical protein